MQPTQKQNRIENENLFIHCNTVDKNTPFFRQLTSLVNKKTKTAKYFITQGMNTRPTMRIILDCPAYENYSEKFEPFFDEILHARNNGVIVETYVLRTLDGWGTLAVKLLASPGHRNMHAQSLQACYTLTTSPFVSNKQQKPEKTVITPAECVRAGFCDHIFTEIKTPSR